MINLEWGKNKQLSFSNPNEYFYSLGLLCHNEWFNIVYEQNKRTKSWTDAYRIECANCPKSKLSNAFINALRDNSRINNNEYVKNLLDNHKFDCLDGKHIYGDYIIVRTTVPRFYINDFNNGYV